MGTITGRMATHRPARYAKQLTSHWSAHGPITDEGGALVQRLGDGRVLVLRPATDHLHIEVSAPADGDISRLADAVKAHLERFGQRENLSVIWDRTTQ
ncbi:MAG TPA: DUF2218 domain-containing protein [Nocardioidaceae bacterium]|nr:DUF2218 domain-containing protein [Nocardioidaceae bacterium]